MTRCLIGLLITLAFGCLVAPLGAAAPPPGTISRVRSLTPEAGARVLGRELLSQGVGR